MGQPFTVLEATTARYLATLQDEAGTPIPGSSLATLTLTLYDRASGEIINGRNAQNVKNANGVTIGEDGALVWTMTPADTAILGSGTQEAHVALFAWTWGGGKTGRHEVTLLVTNLTKVP